LSLKNSSAIVLAGGDSKRIGYPKAKLKLKGNTLIEIIVYQLQTRFNKIILVTNSPELFDGLPVNLVGDIYITTNKNSLRGIHAGLTASASKCNFVIGCDMPFANMELVSLLYGYAHDYQVVVPQLSGHFQPLFAFYQRSCLEEIEESLRNGDYKIANFYQKVKIKTLGEEQINKIDPHHISFFNINTIEDYQKAQEWFQEFHRS